MKGSKTKRQNGIALVSALLILLLLSALAAGLVLMTNTETAVNANYRGERTLDFGARAGIEEVRDRLTAANAATLFSPTCIPASSCLPGRSGCAVQYQQWNLIRTGRAESGRGNSLDLGDDLH
jgi:type II secretory pathway component PulK